MANTNSFHQHDCLCWCCGWLAFSNGVVRVGGRRVATSAANFTKGDVVGVVLDADQGEIVFFRNGVEQGRARGIRGRLYPFISCDSESDQVTLLGSYSLLLDRIPRQLADMEWDTLHHAPDIELSSNCLTSTKTSSSMPSTLRGTMLYTGTGYHEFHVILDSLGPDGVWVGVAPPDVGPMCTVGDVGCGWALHSDGDKRFDGREDEFTQVRTLACEQGMWDEARAGKDLLVIDGLTVTKMANEGGDYATVLGTLCLASGQHSWNVYINHVEDSNLFIGVTVEGIDLIMITAGKLVTRCAEPYAEGDLVSVQLDMDQRHIKFLKNGVAQGLGDGLPEEVWPYISLDNIMDSITLHSSSMFADLLQSLRWSADAASPHVLLPPDGAHAQLRGGPNGEEVSGQGTVLGMREMSTAEVHSWVVRFEQPSLRLQPGPANFLVGVAPPDMDLCRSLGEDGCGIGLDYFGYFYVNGRYFHATNLQHWTSVAKPVRGSTAKHKGKAHPIFVFTEGKCEVTITLDLKEKTLKFAHGGKNIGTIAGVQGPLHAAATVTSSKQKELVSVLKAKGCALSARAEAALLLIPRDLFVPKDRHREAFRDQKLTVRMADGSTMTLPPPSFVVNALDKLGVGNGCRSFLDVGCGTGYVCALAACLLGGDTVEQNCSVHALECASSRLEGARANVRALREHLAGPMAPDVKALDDPSTMLSRIEFSLSNVLIPECTNGVTYDALYCDAALGEEDLPMLLSLLKPNGRMVVVIQEEALLISRSGVDPHDFNRELICRLSGDFGELEGATPWEVQDAISRIKERERRHGQAQAKQDTASLRSFEYVEMQQRVQAAMQRISELEAMIKASELGSMRSPARHLTSSSCFDGGLRSPARSNGVDDVRVVAKDKSRHRRGPSAGGAAAAALAKPSPRASSNARMSPLPSLNVTDSGDWKAMYTTTNGSGPAQDAVHPSPARARARNLFSELPDQGEPDTCTAASDKGVGGLEDSRGLRGQSRGGSPCSPSIGTASSEGHSEGPQVHMSPRTLADIIESMSVQTFSVDEVTQMISGSEPSKVWYCVAHPNISAVLGVCIQPGAGAPPPTPGSAYPTFPLTPSGASAAAAAADCGPPTDLLQSPTVPRMSLPPHSRLAVSSSTKREQVGRIATDVCKALTFLQDLKRHSACTNGNGAAHAHAHVNSSSAYAGAGNGGGGDNCSESAWSAAEDGAVEDGEGWGGTQADPQATVPEVLSAYALRTLVSPSTGPAPSLYAFGVVLLQLLTERGPLGLVRATREAVEQGTLLSLIPRVPANAEILAWAGNFARLALRCTQPGAVTALDAELLPELESMADKLGSLGSMSWEQVEELLMLPLQPYANGNDGASRRWVRQDFRMRRRLFLEEVAKLAVEGPVHKIEVRRARCFKDSVAVFAGKGHAVWRQPLKLLDPTEFRSLVSILDMDIDGLIFETFAWNFTHSSAAAGVQHPTGTPTPPPAPHHLSASSCTMPSPSRAPTADTILSAASSTATAGYHSVGGEGGCREVTGGSSSGRPTTPSTSAHCNNISGSSSSNLVAAGSSPQPAQASTPTRAHKPGGGGAAGMGTTATPPASPFAAADGGDSMVTSIPLKPGGTHLKVSNHNKREYVLLKAHKMLVGTIEAQMGAIIDAFHSVIPRELLEKYAFTSLELQLVVCGEQHIDVQDLQHSCKYEDGYTGKEELIEWFWDVVEGFSDAQRRMLLQFWSGSDGQPADGFASLDPAFHMVAVDRLYDANDTTARLPAAHTCFRQLDLPRYASREELREKLVTAITIGQGYMALS
ncbi:hypothetical protein DUNSADRAFT_12080 [Dunaliella salina]|uniref:HECT-type E3 ubiquitin transferase n=2 Tax=Dunaliella salina TaxID=3046 RepID=A0ABQ7H442_DUNSA|nr:hypothetical protein DUNSADRAFT_12080 [Dunaliella salina]|eukprot:KAF5841624.1 hypothetical protein DUNSADRAFT_12080 [Dunaliella salina]